MNEQVGKNNFFVLKHSPVVIGNGVVLSHRH